MKSSKVHEIYQILIERLLPHPKNANVMAPAAMKKLRRHIEKAGRYEPLLVRPHPTVAGHYELINGHHRKEILASLGHTHAACVVWDLTDAEALVLLATVNRLSGKDAPGKRLKLLEEVAAAMGGDATEMSRFLPEEEAALLKLLRQDEVQVVGDAPATDSMEEAFTVFMKAAEKRELVATLRRTHAHLPTALMAWAAEHGAVNGVAARA